MVIPRDEVFDGSKRDTFWLFISSAILSSTIPQPVLYVARLVVSDHQLCLFCNPHPLDCDTINLYTLPGGNNMKKVINFSRMRWEKQQ